MNTRFLVRLVGFLGLLLVFTWLPINVKLILLATVIFAELWHRRDLRLLLFMVGVAGSVYMTLVIFLEQGFGEPTQLLSYFADVMLLMSAVIYFALSRYDAFFNKSRNTLTTDELVKLAGGALPPEEQSQCPHCSATIPQKDKICSWCGKSLEFDEANNQSTLDQAQSTFTNSDESIQPI